MALKKDIKLPTINKVLAFVQIFILLGSLFIYYRSIEYFVKKERQEQARIIFELITYEFDHIIDDSKTNLTNWAKDLNVDNLNSNACKSPFVKTLDANPLYMNYVLTDNEGRVICSKTPYPKDFTFKTVSDYNRMVENKKITVTGFGISPANNEPRIAVGYPIYDSKEEYKGLIAVAIGLEEINKLIDTFTLAKDSQLLITDRNGVVEVNYPRNDALIGTQVFTPDTFSLILSEKQGIIEQKGSDGKNRIFAYAPYYSSEDDQYISFLMYGVPKQPYFITPPGYINVIQIYALFAALIGEGYILYRILRRNKKK